MMSVISSYLWLCCICACGTITWAAPANVPSDPLTESAVPDTLRFVTLIFRHGDRSPVEVFEGDPNNNNWVDGVGQLTKQGKQREYQLGVWFGNRYRKFLGTSVTNGTFYIRSTDKDRTLASAQLVAAGAFPPTEKDVWNDQLGKLWQPVAVHTIPQKTDPFVDMYPMNDCKRYIQLMSLLQKTPEGKRVLEQNKDLRDLIFTHTGKKMEVFRDFLDPCDTYLVEQMNNMTVPEYIKPHMSHLAHLCEYYTFHYIKTPEMVQLGGGYLVNEIFKRIDDFIAGKLKNLKAYMYSAHDYTSMFIQSVLRVFNYISPPFSSALVIELHEKSPGAYFLKFLYRNDTTREPYVLKALNCEEECPLEHVRTLSKCFFIEDINQACQPFTDAQLAAKQVEYDKFLP